MKAALRSLRSLLFGETWTIPLGVAATLLVAVALRAALPGHTWRTEGGFVLPLLLVLTLVISWRGTRS